MWLKEGNRGAVVLGEGFGGQKRRGSLQLPAFNYILLIERILLYRRQTTDHASCKSLEKIFT